MPGITPAQAYNTTIKATPIGQHLSTHYRVRHDTIDQFGKLTLRRAGKLHHLGVGRNHAKHEALILVDNHEVTITDRATGETLGTYDINPDHNYWANKTKKPDQWPSSL